MNRLPLVPILFLLASPSFGFAVTYVVKPDGTGDFPTIQAAIDGAGDGDVIELTDGTFTRDGNRDIDYMGKAITVRSQSGNPEACLIDCGGADDELHRGFNFSSGENADSVLDGVTVMNGYAAMGGGILCTNSSSPTIEDCVVLNNRCDAFGASGGGVHCENSSPLIRRCRIVENVTEGRAAVGGGVSIGFDCSPVRLFPERFTDHR
jgi:hypothetical protein